MKNATKPTLTITAHQGGNSMVLLNWQMTEPLNSNLKEWLDRNFPAMLWRDPQEVGGCVFCNSYPTKTMPAYYAAMYTKP